MNIRCCCAVLALFLLLAATGCGRETARTLPTAEPFRIDMRLSQTTVAQGQPFPVMTALRNDSRQSWEIHHGLPLIVVEIHSEDWAERVPKINLPVDRVKHLGPGETYDPDTLSFLNGERTLEISMPGRYRLVAVARFRMADPQTGRLEEYTIRSQPADIVVASEPPSGGAS